MNFLSLFPALFASLLVIHADPTDPALLTSPILNIEARTLGGDVTQFDRLLGTKGMVVVAREGGCPISERYGPTLKTLEEKYTRQGFSFVYLYVGQLDIAASAKQDLQKYKLKGSYTIDPQLVAAQHFAMKTTTETLAFNKFGKLIYRGAVDNQQSLAGTNPRASENYLADALDAELKSLPVKVQQTEAPGCQINTPLTAPIAKDKKDSLTFNEHIYPIIEKRCVICHRAESNFLDFTTYDSVRARAKMIRYVLEKNLMPPWKVPAGLGPWVNDLSLPPEEKQQIYRWLEAGTPQGAGKKPESISWAPGWRNGEPDHIIKLPKAVRLKAGGFMPYQHFIIKTNFKKEMWVRSYEILTKPKVVHHISYYILKNTKDTNPANFPLNFISSFTWGMGNPPTIFAPGVGSRIPANAVIGLTVHYQPNGIAGLDKETQLGLKFFSEKPPYNRDERGMADDHLIIPPNQPDHVSKMTKFIERDSYITLMTVHMHVRGKSSQIDLVSPAGQRTKLLEITSYNTYHQFLYEYKTPLFIAKNSTIECTNHFDNSKDNPLNPDPNKEVHWGEQIIDEMSICSIETFSK